MDKFELSIKMLENGWADLSISFNDYEKILHFENVPNDPLYNLLESAIKIINKIESTIVFSNCSQRTYLSVNKLENDFCRVKIENTYKDLSVKQFCKVVLRMFDIYTFTFSKGVYTSDWDTFPETELEKLRAFYHKL